MGAICHVTPVLNDILDLCRFDLTYLTPPPTKILWMHFVTAVQPISIQPLQTQQKPRVTEAQHNAEKHFLFKIVSFANLLKSWTVISIEQLSVLIMWDILHIITS